MGHTRCGAVSSSVELVGSNRVAGEATGCEHLHDELAPTVKERLTRPLSELSSEEVEVLVDEVARHNVQRIAREAVSRSSVIRESVESGQARVVGAVYDVKTGEIEFFDQESFLSQIFQHAVVCIETLKQTNRADG